MANSKELILKYREKFGLTNTIPCSSEECEIYSKMEKDGQELPYDIIYNEEKCTFEKLEPIEVSKEELDELLTYKKLNMLSRISRLANLWYYTTIIGIVILILYGIYKIMS